MVAAETPGWLLRGALAAVLVAIVLLGVREVGSSDVGFHLQAGSYILEGNGWPRTDPFTYTVPDHPYVDTSWGYQVLLAAIERLAGSAGLVLFHALLVATTFGLLYRTATLVPCDPRSLVLLFLVGGVAAEMRYEVRPELVSYAMLAGVLYLLHRHARERPSPLWLLPPIFLVWANMHSLFVLGLAAVGCVWLGLLLARRRPDRRLALWGGVSLLVPLINPYGWKALAFPLTLVTRFRGANVFNQVIGEFVSPLNLRLAEQTPFVPWAPMICFYLLALAVAISLFGHVARRRYWALLLCLPFGYLALSMVRNMPLLVVVGLPLAVQGLPASRLLRSRRVSNVAVALVALAALLLAARVWNDAYYIDNRRTDRCGLGWSRERLPLEATAFARRAGLDGRVLNHLNYGGYLMWARGQPVFIDGRLEVMGESFFEQYKRVLGSPQEMERAVRQYGIEWMIFPYRTFPRLLKRVSADTRWRLVYVDPIAVIFLREEIAGRVAPDPSALYAALAPASVEIETLPGLGGEPRPARAARWIAGAVRRERFPGAEFGLGLFHYFRNEWPRAAAQFAEAIRKSDGAYYELYLNLGSALRNMGRIDEAHRCYRIVLEDDPDNRVALKYLESG